MREKYLTLIELEDVERIKTTAKKESFRDYRLVKRYDVLSIQVTAKLIKPLFNNNEEVKLYVHTEELFDCFIN